MEAFRHRCGAWSSKPMLGSDVLGRFDSCTLPPLKDKVPISNGRHYSFFERTQHYTQQVGIKKPKRTLRQYNTDSLFVTLLLG